MKKVLKIHDPLAGALYWTGGEGELSSDPRKAVVLEEGEDDSAMLDAYDHFEASADPGQFVDIFDLEKTWQKMIDWWDTHR